MYTNFESCGVYLILTVLFVRNFDGLFKREKARTLLYISQAILRLQVIFTVLNRQVTMGVRVRECVLEDLLQEDAVRQN